MSEQTRPGAPEALNEKEKDGSGRAGRPSAPPPAGRRYALDAAGLAAYQADLDAAVAYLRGRVPTPPDCALTLGSGLADLLGDLPASDLLERIPYAEIPGFPSSGAPGHGSELLIARLGGLRLAVLTGRAHAYEGREPWEVVFPVRALAAWGIKTLVLTNAAGSVNPDFAPVSLMLIEDHIALFAPSPLRGPNLERFGPRFPDQSEIYDAGLRARLRACAAAQGLKLHAGVYFYTPGPAYESPAEIRMLARLGADAVGMSTVAEAQAASHAGLRVLGISCLSNWAAGLAQQALSAEEVLDAGREIARALGRLLEAFFRELSRRP